VLPEDFAYVGQPVTVEQIECAISEVVAEINCDCLALSGGVDSSLLLWFMLQTRDRVRAFTIGRPENHPDVLHARMVADTFPGRIDHHVLIPCSGGDGNDAGGAIPPPYTGTPPIWGTGWLPV